MTKKVLMTREYPKIAVDMLTKAGFEVDIWTEEASITYEALLGKSKNYNALLCTLSEKIDKNFLNINKHLDIISQYAVGFDNIDIEAASEQGIFITNTPDVLSKATADIAFALLLATSRKMFYLHKTIIQGKWKYFKPSDNLGIELEGKTLGILGLGRIGLEMAKRCCGAYNMNMIYHNRKPNEDLANICNGRYVSFDSLLKESDIISLHCSLNPSTEKLFNKEAFEKMKKTAIFINTARGKIHDEKALIEALEKGEIWGAGLDVSDPEPMHKDNPLLAMNNVAVVPHIGTATIEARGKMASIAASNIIEFYKTGKPLTAVNILK